MYVRQTRHHLPPHRIDPVIEDIRTKQMPKMAREPGFGGGYILADRITGRVVGLTMWDNESQMKASEDSARSVRQAIERWGEHPRESPNVERYELVVEHPANGNSE